MTRITKHLPTIREMIDEMDRIGMNEFLWLYKGYEGYSSEHSKSIDFLFAFINHQNKTEFMGKMKELYLTQQETGSIDDQMDSDYLYEQYLLQEKLNEEYWEYVSKTENNPDYIPTPEEEEKNFQQILKQNGNTK